VIINNDNRELAGIILFGKRADGLCDGSGFIARGNDSGDTRPVCQRLWLDVLFVYLPEISAREQEVYPDRKRNGGEKSR